MRPTWSTPSCQLPAVALIVDAAVDVHCHVGVTLSFLDVRVERHFAGGTQTEA